MKEKCKKKTKQKKKTTTLPWIVSAQNRDSSLAAHHLRDTSQEMAVFLGQLSLSQWHNCSFWHFQIV